MRPFSLTDRLDFYWFLPFNIGESGLYISIAITVDITHFAIVNGRLNINRHCHNSFTDGRIAL